MSLAEEAIGLAKSVGWEVDYGLKYQEAEELQPEAADETQKDEWQDDQLRESIAGGSIVRIRAPLSPSFLGKGQLTATLQHIRSNKISVVFVNTTLSPQQLKSLEK